MFLIFMANKFRNNTTVRERESILVFYDFDVSQGLNMFTVVEYYVRYSVYIKCLPSCVNSFIVSLFQGKQNENIR